jgi:TolA-binding protein
MPKPSSSALVPSPDPQIIDPNNDLAVDFFFEENKGQIIVLIVVALLGLGGWIFYHYSQGQKLTAESSAFYAAKSPEDWQKIIAQYPGSIVAGNAQLLLADKLRDEQKIDQALTILSDFTKNTDHPLIAQGWLSYGATLEQKGDTEKALQAYTTVATQYGTSEAAPAALNAQARLAKKTGDTKKVREIYENIVQRFPASLWSQEAQQELGKLPK